MKPEQDEDYYIDFDPIKASEACISYDEDLRYIQKKIFEALRIPKEYLISPEKPVDKRIQLVVQCAVKQFLVF